MIPQKSTVLLLKSFHLWRSLLLITGWQYDPLLFTIHKIPNNYKTIFAQLLKMETNDTEQLSPLFNRLRSAGYWAFPLFPKPLGHFHLHPMKWTCYEAHYLADLRRVKRGEGCSVSFASIFGSWAKIFLWGICRTSDRDLWIRGGFSVNQYWEKGSSIYRTTSKEALLQLFWNLDPSSNASLPDRTQILLSSWISCFSPLPPSPQRFSSPPTK